MSYSTHDADRRHLPWRASLAGSALAAVLAMSCGGCSSEATADGDEPRVFTRSDDGTTATLTTGESFQVHVTTNASTGFSWEFVLSEADVVEQVGTDFAGTDGVEGASSTRIDTYEALRTGEVRLDGYYFRSWEVDGLPEQPDFTLNLVVE